MNSVKDQVVVITGGSKGFGFACAKKLAVSGAKLALMARNEIDLQKAKETLIEITPDADILMTACDISNSEEVNKSFKVINEHFGKIDHFVNNAGLAKISKIESLSDQDLALQLNTNISGNILCCRAVIPYLKTSSENGSNSRIVNVSSASAYHTDEMAHLSVYAATKAAMERLSRELRRELEPYQIGVSILRPGAAMDTDFASNLDFDNLKEALVDWQDQGPHCFEGMNADHVAESVAFCLSMPKGVSVDLLEIRPNIRMKKPIF